MEVGRDREGGDDGGISKLLRRRAVVHLPYVTVAAEREEKERGEVRGEREQETQMEGAVGAHFAPPRQGTHIDLESLSSVRASSMVWTSFLFPEQHPSRIIQKT